MFRLGRPMALTALLVAAFAADGSLRFRATVALHALQGPAPQAGSGSFICPMHPDVHGAAGQTCPRCGMALVKSEPASFDANIVDLDITPRALKPNQPARLKVTIREPANGRPVRDLENVHERPLHLFVVSQDLEHFAHLHPEPLSDGSLEMPFTVPRADVYQLYFDFMPRGGTPQLIHRSFVTAGYGGGVKQPHLAADTTPKVDRSLRVDLQLPADGLVAGRTQLFRCSLTDTRSRAPITNLQQYLGASGHLFVVSDDLEFAAHSHPVPDFSDVAGPNLVFDALFPRPGLYRLWAQFRHSNDVVVASFTVAVRPE